MRLTDPTPRTRSTYRGGWRNRGGSCNRGGGGRVAVRKLVLQSFATRVERG